MYCLNCGVEVGVQNICPNCGTDLRIYKKIRFLSNAYYNWGLEKAKVRDLTGAISDLKYSLEIDKANVDARNLLGLCYFEMGEVVEALTQWIISKNMLPEQNIANKYIKSIQSNPNRLEELNQTIRKYNLSLQYCRQGSDDLAIIQLKKVLSKNGKYVKAHLLLGLMYLKNNRNGRARVEFERVLSVDRTNTLALAYLKELDERASGGKKDVQEPDNKLEEINDDSISYTSGNQTIIMPKKPYQEISGANIIINLIIGMVVGVALMWFLVVPAKVKSEKNKSNQQVLEYSDQLAAKQSDLDALTETLAQAQARLEDFENGTAESEENVSADLLAQAMIAYREQRFDAAAQLLSEVRAERLTDAELTLFTPINYELNPTYYEALYNEGKVAHESRNYAQAIDKLRPVVLADINYDSGYALFYLAESCEQQAAYAEALEYYTLFIELHPDTDRAESANEAIGRLAPLAGVE